VGINSLKSLKNGTVQIERSSKEEIETLTRDINEKCGGELEANVHTLRRHLQHPRGYFNIEHKRYLPIAES